MIRFICFIAGVPCSLLRSDHHKDFSDMHRVQFNILKEIKKGDLILLTLFLLAAAGIVLTAHTSAAALHPDADTAIVEIRVNGEIRGQYPLSKDRVIRVSTDYGENEITIEEGEVSVTGSDCANQICVQTGKIHSAQQMIVCLPHRLTVEIISSDTDNESDSDAAGGDFGSADDSLQGDTYDAISR